MPGKIAELASIILIEIVLFFLFGLFTTKSIKAKDPKIFLHSIVEFVTIALLCYFGSLIVSKLIKVEWTAYELLLIYSTFSVLLCMLCKLVIRKDKDIKITVLKAICTLSIIVAIYSTLTQGQATINSDTATATLLAQTQIQKTSLFPAEWNYANGSLWTIGISTPALLFSSIMRDQSLARMLSSVFVVFAAIIGIVFFSRKIFGNKAWTVIIPLFLIFHVGSYPTNDRILYSADYTCSMLWIALGTTFTYYAAIDKKKKYMILYMLLSFVLYIGGIRFAAEQGIPLLGALLILDYLDVYKDKKCDYKEVIKKLIRYGIIIIVPMVAGYRVYKWISSWHNMNDGRSSMMFTSTLSACVDNIRTYFLFLFDTFGYQGKVALLSPAGIWNVIALVVCFIVCFIIPLLQAFSISSERKEIRFFYYFGIIHNFLMFFTIVFFGMLDASRYVLTSVYVNIIISARYIYDRYIVPRNVGSRFWVSVFSVVTMVACCLMISQSNGWAGRVENQEQFNKIIADKGLKKGYASYWNAYKNEIFSDFNVHYGAVLIESSKIRPQSWLISEDVFLPLDQKSFLLLTEQENRSISENISLLYGEPKESFQLDGYYIYVFDYDIASRLRALTDNVLKPIEMYYNEAVQLTEESCTISPGGVVYGPYEKMKAGEYEIVFIGQNIGASYCDIYSNGKSLAIETKEISRTENEVIFHVVLIEDITDTEIRAFNKTADQEISLEQITITEFLSAH